MSFSVKNKFFLVIGSPGGPDMVNGYILPQNAMQHDDNCVVNFGGENKNSVNWCAQQS